MGWLVFAAAFALFLFTHSIPLRPPVKTRLVARLGARGFTLAYSALSLAALGWLIHAAGRAPYIELWGRAAWQNHAALAAMALVCLILAISFRRPNPFSFGGARNDIFACDNPGVIRWLRHPMLAALAIWSMAHLIPNGDLAHVMLFGTFAGFSFMGMWIVDRRKRREMGATGWQCLWTDVQRGPLVPTPRSWARLLIRVGCGVALYMVLIALHPAMFGVSPLP
ncbi:NnrU family protein [Thalassovita taeanensis]|uniref:Uncharacterized membrane protein n=1 Tax=Thalassovita taeanensis TaxID=657014 RepID=A0A1H9GEF5_9RHOB|nr:NnrU family protein [Thalassovita taeanensis]SEQ48491.1 Uncharacterized membrane protein [Thalassovita taeanensis]